MNNSIIDLIIRIKNGYLAKKEVIHSPYSVFKINILKKLLQLKFIKNFKVEEDKNKLISIELNYNNGIANFTDVKIFSKPGRRYYVSYRDLKPVLSGYGFSIISTSKGIKTDKEAKKEKLGGELLFNIW